MTDFEPAELIQADHRASTYASASVDAVSLAEMLRESSKDVLAGIMTDIKKGLDGTKVSEAELERLARSSPEWKDFRAGQFEAAKEGLRAKVTAQNAERYFQAIQSVLSYRREELKRLPST